MPVYTQTYAEKLRAHLDEQTRLNQVNAENIKPQNQMRSVKPLTEQINELMQSMPTKLLNRPWSMAELVLRLDGKYRDRPHAKQVSEALRILYWQRVRYWRKGYDGARLWLPPHCVLIE